MKRHTIVGTVVLFAATLPLVFALLLTQLGAPIGEGLVLRHLVPGVLALCAALLLLAGKSAAYVLGGAGWASLAVLSGYSLATNLFSVLANEAVVPASVFATDGTFVVIAFVAMVLLWNELRRGIPRGTNAA